MSGKTKYPRAAALEVARGLCQSLKPFTERLIVAGSLRRRKEQVGDVEILYIPKFSTGKPVDLFSPPPLVNNADELLATLLFTGIKESRITHRLNVKGSSVWGQKNKLAIHVASGIPVDFFAATEANWWNYLVCRTGGAASNMRIASTAQGKGWKWQPYGAGFRDNYGDLVPVTSERACFELIGLDYLEPWERK